MQHTMFSNVYNNASNKAEIIGDTYFSDNIKEVYKRNRKTSIVETTKNKVVLNSSSLNTQNMCSHIDVSWLPFAAGHYHISPNIKDYIVTVIPALTSDIPNRNMQGFMTKTLFEFDIQYACQRYKTFIGRPVCKNHNNKDLSLAQGIVVDASLVPVPKYKVVKVMLLALIDRTKCDLVRDVMSYGGKYSMGALAGTFQCSICGGVLGPGCRRTCTCYHSNYNDISSLGGVYNGRLHFIMACDPVWGEISVLSEAPADPTAIGEYIK